MYIYIYNYSNQKTCARCIFVSSSFSKGTKNVLNGWSPAIWRLLPGDASGSGGVEQPPETKDPLGFFGGRKNGFGFVPTSKAEGKLRPERLNPVPGMWRSAPKNQCSQCCLLFVEWLLGLYPHSNSRPWRVDEELAYTWHGICVTLFAVQAWWRSNDWAASPQTTLCGTLMA